MTQYPYRQILKKNRTTLCWYKKYFYTFKISAMKQIIMNTNDTYDHAVSARTITYL